MNAETATDPDDRAAFHGRRQVDGLVLDVALIGPGPARLRVLEAWQPGSRLLALDTDRWLLVFARPVSLEVQRAPGLPVTIGPDRTVTIRWHGRASTTALDDLTDVPVAGWFDLSALRVEQLRPLEKPAVAAAVPVQDPPRRPDLRKTAGIRPDARRDRMAAGLAATSRGWFRRGRGTGPAAAGASRTNWLDVLARLFPEPTTVSRREQRYLSALIQQFEQREYDAALRAAIGLGGAGARLSLRLPGRRAGTLRPGGPAAGGRGFNTGSLDGRLRELYHKAANELEALGRVEEAAFVHADLLGSVLNAVNLLERHQRFELAAELAQAHDLAADTAVRLWWRAGQRDRAVQLALARGAFAGAIATLHGLDPAGALALRRAWVESCRAAGNSLGAVHAGWPEIALRDDVLADLRQAMALGGPASGELLAMMVTYRPTEAGQQLAASLLAADDPGLVPARDRYVLTLSDQQADHPAADRRLATDAARSVLLDGTLAGLGPADAGKRWQALVRRADPLAAADLPRPVFRHPGAVQHDLIGLEPTGVPVLDAVQLSGGVLVALGALGVRLLTTDGRVRARWGTPTHGFVVADHGGTVLLLNRGDGIVDVHRLDLATRQVRHWCTLSLRWVLPSYDGAVLIAEGEDGLVFLDTTTARPRVLWRELQPPVRVLDLARSPESLSALVSDPEFAGGAMQIWRWSMPQIILRSRNQVEIDGAVDSVLAADGRLLSLHPSGPADGELRHLRSGEKTPTAVTVDSGGEIERWPAGIHAAGDELFTSSQSDDAITLKRFSGLAGDKARVHVTLPGLARQPGSFAPQNHSQPGIRLHARRLTVYDQGGRVVSVELTGRGVGANLVVRP